MVSTDLFGFGPNSQHHGVEDHAAGVMVVGSDDGTGKVERVAHEVASQPNPNPNLT